MLTFPQPPDRALRRAALLLSVLPLLLAPAACGGEAAEDAGVPETTVPAAEEPPGVADPCELLSAEEVREVTGVEVLVPEATGVSICQWQPVDAVERAMLVNVALLPYEGGAEPDAVCAQTAAAVGEVDELDRFAVPAFTSTSGEGSLRTVQLAVCPDPAVLIVTVVGGEDDGARVEAAVALAELALPRL